jgi:DNA polymerase-3 subunit alpha
MAMFAEYGFNKSHTAAYAVVTYQTAWLKAHYPAEFMAATLSSDMDDTDKVQLFVSDTKHNGVQLLAPDVHASAWRFEPVYEAGKAAIRYGLGAVKGAGEAAVKHLLAARSQGRFKHLFDLCKRVDRRVVNRRTLEAMIRAGALDEIEHDRARALASVGLAMDEAEKSLASLGQESLFAEAFGQEPDQSTEMHYLKVPSWSERQRLQEEKLALGFFLSGHLFHAYASEVRRFAKTPLAQIHPAPQGQWVAGIVTALRTQMTRRGKMLFISLDDSSATLEAAVFAESIDKHRQILKVDALLIVYGRVSRDDYSGGQRLVV